MCDEIGADGLYILRGHCGDHVRMAVCGDHMVGYASMKPGDLVNHCGMIYELVEISGEFAFIRCGTWCDCVLLTILVPIR